MRLLIDSNVVLAYARGGMLADRIDEVYQPFGGNSVPVISVVVEAEVRSIAYRNKWGAKRMQQLEELLALFAIAPIARQDIIDRYIEIDAYSQGRHQTLASNFSARNMGKNDLWIAATASVANAILLTTDQDFNHLHEVFLEVGYFDPAK